MQDRGEISELEVQVPYECVVEGKKICKYFADFRYRCGEDVIVEDTKGVITQVFTLKETGRSPVSRASHSDYCGPKRAA